MRTVAIVAAALATPAALGEPLTDALRLELAADAAARTQNAGEASGHDKRGFFMSDDGANSLVIGGLLQFRYYANLRDGDALSEQEDFTHGFQVRRARLRFGGTIGSKDVSYFIQTDANRDDGLVILLDAYGKYAANEQTSIRWGQYKVNFLREENVGDDQQLAVERGLLTAVFGQNRSQGVGVSWQGEEVRGWVDFTDGINTLNTDFNDDTEADWALTGRFEWKWAGKDWGFTKDFTSWRGSPYAGLLGVAAHVESGGETGQTVDRDRTMLTIDAAAEGNGWNAFVAGVWRRTDTGTETDDMGFVAQAGVFVSDQAEVFARWDGILADDANGEDLHSVTGGVTYFVIPKSHAVKLTADVTYYLDAEGDSVLVRPSTGTGLLADTEDGQVVVRVMGQLVF